MKTNRWIVQEVNHELQQKLVRELEISPILANLLINRGYSEPEEVRAFLNPSLDNLTSPFALLNMGAAVEKILTVLERREKIMVYGDYDVDGICASVILYQGLKELGADVDYYVPNRIEEGYGINIPALETIAEAGVKLIITVDCGISAVAEIEAAKKKIDEEKVAEQEAANKALAVEEARKTAVAALTEYFALVNPSITESIITSVLSTLESVKITVKPERGIRSKTSIFDNWADIMSLILR